MTITTDARLSIRLSTPLGKDKLIASAFDGTEAVSEPFLFTLTAGATAEGLDASALMGKGMTVTLVDGEGKERHMHGLITRLAVQQSQWRIELRPWLWLLTLSTDCRIFQNKSAPDIIKAVFGDLGYKDYKDSLTGTYAEREYCVQYNETNFAFVSRLMEEEGIWYRFEHADGKHTLVLADDCSAHTACPNVSKAKFLELPQEKTWLDNNRVEALVVEHAVVSGKYQADDFNFQTPKTELKVHSAGAGTHRIYEYPGFYDKKDLGSKYADHRVQEFEAPSKRIAAESDVRHFTAGCKFTLEKHPDSTLNADWALLSVSHSATPHTYRNSFTAFHADVVFRPPRFTPRPRIPGTQTAIVVGKSGEEIWTDKYGRIKVQFHWDQLGKNDENSSCWIRVSQTWAGKGWGAWVLPRIGQEVVVSFLEGDPDRPLVTGCVYNGDHTLPYPLPDEQTKSTLKSHSSKDGAGFNEIRFEDKKDSEEIYTHAQKDMTTVIENSRTTTLNKGNDKLIISKGNRTLTISEGNETHEVKKGTRAITVKDSETHTNESDFSQKVSGNHTLKVSGNLTIDVSGSITFKSGEGMTIQAGTSLTAKAGTEATLQGGTTLTAKAGTDATLQGGTTVTVKGAASGTVDGGGSLAVKGGMVQIN